MYFFSATDPNYRIKGSRDPLGFQSLWAAAGRRAVAHLSTVSVNIRDFMILAYSEHFHRNRDEKQFLPFFLKFEQACAYARRIYNNDSSFNGVDFVNKHWEDEQFSISLNASDTLLSNQRNYGIYGKYVRPYRDMGISTDADFNSIMEDAISKTNRQKVASITSRLYQYDKTMIHRNDLECIGELLANPTDGERELFVNYILKSQESHHPQNDLFRMVELQPQIANAPFNLHSVIQALLNVPSISDDLRDSLLNIENTDHVLLPFNRSFSHLLHQSTWTNAQINEDSFFQQLPSKREFDFHDQTVRSLNDFLELNAIDLVQNILARNEEVSKTRGSKPWIIKEGYLLKVIYGENGQSQKEIDYTNDYEFPYFLNTYLSLYKQILLNR